MAYNLFLKYELHIILNIGMFLFTNPIYGVILKNKLVKGIIKYDNFS